MVGLEKEILYLVSRVRYVTDIQVGKAFNSRKRSTRRPLKKTLRKMCNDYTLRKVPCNINYSNFKDNTCVYYLNGSNILKGKNLTKMLIGSEIAIRMSNAGYETARFYRNAKIGDKTYDIFIEYVNPSGVRQQVVIDIELENKVKNMKYLELKDDINNSTIPFFMVPKVIVVSGKEIKNTKNYSNIFINYIDTSLNKLLSVL